LTEPPPKPSSAPPPSAPPESGGGPLCSVVVITWNRRAELGPTLDALFAQSCAERLEVVVIDNGSTDGTVEWLTREYPHRVRVLAFPRNMGACHGRNAGIRAATAPYVCFIDSDAILLTPTAIENAVAHLRNGGDVRVVSGRIWFDRECTKPFLMGGYITHDGHFDVLRSLSCTEDPMFVSTCFAVWEKRLLEELGGFNPWYFWKIEDMDLSLRAYFRHLRGESAGATRYHLLEHVHVHHDMSLNGRTIAPDDFMGTFAIFERQRLYLVLSYGGPLLFLRVILRGPFRIARMEHAWQRRLTLVQRLRALVLWPAWRVLMMPLNLWQIRRNHLPFTPVPAEVPPRRPVPAV
jgi:GT2 family glycosyltransferase